MYIQAVCLCVASGECGARTHNIACSKIQAVDGTDGVGSLEGDRWAEALDIYYDRCRRQSRLPIGRLIGHPQPTGAPTPPPHAHPLPLPLFDWLLLSFPNSWDSLKGCACRFGGNHLNPPHPSSHFLPPPFAYSTCQQASKHHSIRPAHSQSTTHLFAARPERTALLLIGLGLAAPVLPPDTVRAWLAVQFSLETAGAGH